MYNQAVKCIAIGNRIMGDDSIGIKVLEEISPKLKYEKIELIFGETDIDYTFSKIDKGDFLFIIDSTCLGIKPGTVTFSNINEFIKSNKNMYSQHQGTIIDLINIYKIDISGFIIGIEAPDIGFRLELSSDLEKNFYFICDEIYKFICNSIGGLNNNA
jgi:hydrogenase maturation protease